MRHKDKVITSLPLTELWDEDTALAAYKISSLNLDELKEIVRIDHVRFVVANVGDKLKWIDQAHTYSFWKQELKDHLYIEGRPHLEDYPDEYFYFASLWQLDTRNKAIVLEKQH